MLDGAILSRTSQVLDRCSQAIMPHVGGSYRLGGGTMDPGHESPIDDLDGCDCSGLVAWAIGAPRLQPGKRWVNTTSMWLDAHGPQRWFNRLYEPELGSILVYGSDVMRGRLFGHCAIVTARARIPVVWRMEERACWLGLTITECRGPRGRSPAVVSGSAIAFHRQVGRRRGTAILWPRHITRLEMEDR
jgi:hypothetical protein